MPRWLDVFVAGVLFVMASPVMMVLFIYSWITFGEAVFKQVRCGMNGEAFTIYKVVTMHSDRRKVQLPYVGDDRRKTHKSSKDPRITRTSGVIRRLGLDELPQLYNVIRGDMSMVGPRPELMRVAQEKSILRHVRHSVRPGITGLWQVKVHSQEGDMLKYLHLDQQYVMEKSIWTDLKLLAATPLAVIKRILR